MKKFLGNLAAISLMATSVIAGTSALAESDVYPQPEGGKKFETNWGITGGKVDINYEEEGYRVQVELENFDNMSTTVWNYNCSYAQEKDALVSMSSSKYTYTTDINTSEQTNGVYAYDGLDEEGQESVFTISDKGTLLWKDGRENAGADLEFTNIGFFDGTYANKNEKVSAQFSWEGLYDEDSFFYTVYLRVGEGESYTEYLMRGFFNPETKKLECDGAGTVFHRNAEGGYDAVEELTDNFEVVFSKTADGKVLYETSNIVLDAE